MNNIASSFGKAAQRYEQAARLQREVALDTLPLLKDVPVGTLLDLGCGPGWFHSHLSTWCNDLWALDISPQMLAKTQSQQIASRLFLASAEQIPVAAESVDVVFSSLMLQWAQTPQQVFAEVFRVLKPGGKFVMTTLVSGSLDEFHRAWQHAGYPSPALQFIDTEMLLRQVHQVGLTTRALQKSYSWFFPDVFAVAREFKQIGANYLPTRQPGLSGKARWQAFGRAYEPFRTAAGLPLTYQVLFLFGEKPR